MSKHCEGKWIWEREGAGWTLMTSTAYVDLGLKPHPVISMSRSQEGKRKEREIWHEAYLRFMALGLCHALATSYGNFDMIFSIRKSIQHFVPTMILHTGVCWRVLNSAETCIFAFSLSCTTITTSTIKKSGLTYERIWGKVSELYASYGINLTRDLHLICYVFLFLTQGVFLGFNHDESCCGWYLKHGCWLYQ